MTAVAAPPRRRAATGWILIAVAVVVLGIVAAAIGSIVRQPALGLLEPDAASPSGTRALVRVLESQGVRVVVARSLAEAEAAAVAGTTLALGATSPLSDETVQRLAAGASDVVLLEPATRDLRLLLDAAPAGIGGETAEPRCELAEAQRAGAVTPWQVFSPASGTVACYPAGDGHGLLVSDRDGTRVAAVDAAGLFTNEHLATEGNAALAAGLLGRHATLVWYLPALADSDLEGDASIGELSPDWVTPAITMLVLATIAAGVWRGRRFGPLVFETLPVTVRADETTRGRARLYQRTGDRTHALDRLRLATLDRLATRLGLGPAATVDEIADAAAARLGADRGRVRYILRDGVAGTDRELVDLAEALRGLDDAVAQALHPERKNP
ncbi:DUF4350 domain-containing protein [Microbacterium sp. No. 7]|uniref:DUF4350 domain-containing protein n=1 Tax=Microbacterium sp. No. 7 TaxID=1714373 RepID=UPI0006D19B7E|nr:DUF4350 domain-containing protein [Microbacterium sp. No. 7]ALJ21281.1 hypothetical protein AOA12_15790 [Microbacterium sp. No. 7]